MIACSALCQFSSEPMYFSLLFGSRSDTCAVNLSKLNVLKIYSTMSITFMNSSFNWSGRQKMWASSCVNPRTRVSPCNSPLCS